MAAGALNPEAQNAMLQRALNIEAQPSEILQREATARRLDKVPTFQQHAALTLANTLLGKQERQRSQVVTTNEGPSGEKTSAREKHAWLIDSNTGERIAYVGPVTVPTPTGGGASVEDKRYFSIENTIMQQVMREMAMEGRGDIIDLPDGSQTINLKNPSRDLPELRSRAGARIRFEKGRSRLPADWHEPDTAILNSARVLEQQGRVVDRADGEYFVYPDGHEQKILNISDYEQLKRLRSGIVVRLNGRLVMNDAGGPVTLRGQ